MKYFNTPDFAARFPKPFKLNPKKGGDLTGVTIPRGTFLDLNGKTFTTDNSVVNFGAIVNGSLVGTDKLPDHAALINVPQNTNVGKPNTGTLIENVTGAAGSYNGLAKIWAEDATVASCTVNKGTGWGVMGWESHRLHVDGLVTDHLRRGGLYIGKDENDADGVECYNVLIENCILDTADEESPFRFNTAVNATVRNNIFNNLFSKSKKESAQFRGRSGNVYRNIFLSSIAIGQQPNGMTQSAVFSFRDNICFGYITIEAGGDATFTHDYFINQPTLSGKSLQNIARSFGWRNQAFPWSEYVKPKIGNGAAINCQSATRGLPDGKAKLIDCSYDATGGLTKTNKRVSQIGTTMVVANGPKPV